MINSPAEENFQKSAQNKVNSSLVTAEAGVCADRGVVAHVHAGVRTGDVGHVRAGPSRGQARPRDGRRGQRFWSQVCKVGMGQGLASCDSLFGVEMEHFLEISHLLQMFHHKISILPSTDPLHQVQSLAEVPTDLWDDGWQSYL